MTPKRAHGFTLLELVLVMLIASILAAMSTDVITLPVNSYLDLERRATLVNTAESTLNRMQRDIRRALPNSIRISGGGTVLELLHTTDGGYYRAQKASDGSGDLLDFTGLDTSFEVLGNLNAVPTGELVIYNLGIAGADAYIGDNRATLSNASSINNLSFTAKQFPFPSPQQRFFIVDTPITYKCLGTQLLRYDSYAIATIPVLGVASLQADKIAACHFSYNDGKAMRSGLITLAITLTDSAGESVQLLQQVHVDNAP
ncbi:MAG: type II secretion system protein [Methylococcaceae bacterium]|nr:type II secretion system protein [Methylococcaceae bacterium]